MSMLKKNKNLEKGVCNSEFKISEGEKYIAEYLKSERIKFKQEVPIVNLKGDTKNHRRADFYLTNYKVYIEFYGRWNNTKEDRERYSEKKKVFYNNRVSCVYLYPENLGIIDFSLSQRLKKELNKRGRKKELFFYNLKRFMKLEERRLFIIVLLFGFLFLYKTIDEVLIVFSLISVFGLIRVSQAAYKEFSIVE